MVSWWPISSSITRIRWVFNHQKESTCQFARLHRSLHQAGQTIMEALTRSTQLKTFSPGPQLVHLLDLGLTQLFDQKSNNLELPEQDGKIWTIMGHRGVMKNRPQIYLCASQNLLRILSAVKPLLYTQTKHCHFAALIRCLVVMLIHLLWILVT